jgi:hypothetical protein
MTRRLMMFTILALLLAGAAFAHGDFRIIGTVAGKTATTLDVKQTKDGKVISMAMDKSVVVTREGKPVPASELKTGSNVVVQAVGDSLDELEIVEIKILPPAKK